MDPEPQVQPNKLLLPGILLSCLGLVVIAFLLGLYTAELLAVKPEPAEPAIVDNGVEQEAADEIVSEVSEDIDTDQQTLETFTITYTAKSDDGFDITYSIVHELPFSFQGKPGRVVHGCDPNLILWRGEQPDDPVCLNGVFAIEWQGAYTVVDRFTHLSFEDVYSLYQIGFPISGGLGVSTSSTAAETTLLVKTSSDRCFVEGWLGVCLTPHPLSYLIEFPTRTVIDVDGAGYHTGLELFFWNASGTKAVAPEGCWAGCPNEVLSGFDMETRGFTTLLTEDVESYSDDIRFDFPKGTTWVDDATILINNTISRSF